MKSLLCFQTAIFVLIFSTSLTAQPSIGGYNVYFGSLHSHSDVSDGTGTPDEAYNFAKNTSHLDFFGLSDHSDLINETEWTAMKTAADAYNEPGVFTSFRGFEWTSYTYGHVTVVNSEVNCPADAPVISFTDLCNWLEYNECIAFFNHPGYANQEGKEFNHFSTPPSDKIIGMELWNSTQGFDIYYYNDGYYCNDVNKGYFDEALTRNWKIGALGSEDNHSGTWGQISNFRMAVLASANTRNDIYNALKEKRFYSTLDMNLCLSFQINGFEMGSTVAPGTYELRIRASDGNGELFTQVQLLNNSAVITTWNPNLASPDLTMNLTFENNHYYYVRVKQADGNEAISSPVWISNGNLFPTASVTSPVANQVFIQPANIPITVSATDQDGTISKVDFYQGCTYLGTVNSTPYTYSWTNVVAGTYELTAKATDNTGGSTFSLPIKITVKPPNQPPAVSLTSPASGAIYTAPASVTLNATATDPDGSVVKVDFYQGNTLLNSDTSTPYSFNWTNVLVGNYSITAKATDSEAATTVSSPVAISVVANQPPVVQLTSPGSGDAFTAPATITLNASATDPDGTITQIAFYYGENLLFTDNSAPYSYTVSGVPQGSYTLTARATDNAGTTVTSTPVSIQVNAPTQLPAVSITSPQPGEIFSAPATIIIVATASDADGIAQVEFFYGGTLLGSDNTSPYSYTANNVPAGYYQITAKATDNLGISSETPPVLFSVVANQAPVVSVTSPQPGAGFTAPASIVFSATASDADGTIKRVEFYQGNTLLQTDDSSPYSFNWTNVPAGNYTLTAKALDNLGASITSSPVAIIVTGSNQLPEISVINPSQGDIFAAPATIQVIAAASDLDGSIARVDFYYKGTILSTDNSSPYTYTASNIGSGEYTISAQATDNEGAVKMSDPVTFTVVSNQAPVIVISSPASGSIYTAPASIVFTASASDSDGNIAHVDFYEGNILLGSDNQSPYTFTWNNVPEGVYTLTAKATDNIGVYTISPAVTISVNSQLEEYTITKRIQTGADDVEERASGIMLLNSDDIEFVFDTNTTGNQIVGLRFRGINVPNGATVTSASIQFTVDETDAGGCNLVIRGEKSGNAQSFTSAYKNVSGRTKTNAAVSWSPPAWTSVGTAQLTPNIGVIVQEIINSAAWSSGNSMVFIFTGNGTRTAESFEGNQAKAALLTINYTVSTIKSATLQPLTGVSVKTTNDQSASSTKLICFPVPFTHELTINFIPDEGEYAKKMELLNSVGNFVFVRDMFKNQVVMDMQNLQPGVYIVRIVSNRGSYKKLVMKH